MHRTPIPSRPARRYGRRTWSIATAIVVIGTSNVAARTVQPPPPDALQQFFDEQPDWHTDERGDCEGAFTNVAYVENRVIVSAALGAGGVAGRVDTAIDTLVGPPSTGAGWVAAIEEVVFPKPGGIPTVTRLYQVDLRPRPEGHDLLHISRRVHDMSADVEAAPDYAMIPGGPFNVFWPNGWPTAAPGLDPARNAPTVTGADAGDGVRITVYDTGLARPADPADLVHIERVRPFDVELPDKDRDGVADFDVAGHGIAISGVIQTVAPGATIEVARVAEEGRATDLSIVNRIAHSLREEPIAEWPNILSLSFGSPACLRNPNDESEGYIEPVALRHAVDVIDELAEVRPGGMLMIAAAGNRGESRPYYPAAFDNVVGVGAIDATGNDGDSSPWTSADGSAPVAEFSNRGEWVDAWTPGVALPTTHLDGLVVSDDPDAPRIDGYAKVDGTSYSAPVAAGLVADLMSRDATLDARCAWESLEVVGGGPDQPLGDPIDEDELSGATVVLDVWDAEPRADRAAAGC